MDSVSFHSVLLSTKGVWASPLCLRSICLTATLSSYQTGDKSNWKLVDWAGMNSGVFGAPGCTSWQSQTGYQSWALISAGLFGVVMTCIQIFACHRCCVSTASCLSVQMDQLHVLLDFVIKLTCQAEKTLKGMSVRLRVKMGHRGNRQTGTVRPLALLSHSFCLFYLQLGEIEDTTWPLCQYLHCLSLLNDNHYISNCISVIIP